MSTATTSALRPNRWLYRCVHGHVHEVRDEIRAKFCEFEQLRLENGIGLISYPSPGEWNSVPEWEIREPSVFWIKVKDRSCSLLSDDEIREMFSSVHLSPNANVKKDKTESKSLAKESSTVSGRQMPQKMFASHDGRSAHKSLFPRYQTKRSRSIGEEARNADVSSPDENVVPSSSKANQPEYGRPKVAESAKTGIFSRADTSTSSNETQSKRSSLDHESDDAEPDFVQDTSRVGFENFSPTSSRTDESDTRTRSKGVGEHGYSPVYESKCLLEKLKSEYPRQLPQNLVLLTYFVRLPVETYKRNDAPSYRDSIIRYVPIVKVRIVSQLGLRKQYEQEVIVDIGSDSNIAPELGFSKSMMRDIAMRSSKKTPESRAVQLRWRRGGFFDSDRLVRIALKTDMVGRDGAVKETEHSASLSVTQSFDMPLIIFGYPFIRPFIAAVDFAENHLYFVHRVEQNFVLRFDIDRWTRVHEVIGRSARKLNVVSTATKVKLYRKNSSSSYDSRWYPIRNEDIEETAPPELTDRLGIWKLEHSNVTISYTHFTQLKEDERYSYPEATDSTSRPPKEVNARSWRKRNLDIFH